MNKKFTLLACLILITTLAFSQFAPKGKTNFNPQRQNGVKSSTVHRLDSVVSENSREYYKYDQMHRVITQEYYGLNENNVWTGEIKETYVYDDAGNIQVQIDYSWNSETKEWVNYSKEELAYNINRNITSKVNSYWSDNVNLWILSSRNDYTYDQFGNELTDDHYNYNSSEWQLLSQKKSEYTYNSQNLVLTQIDFKLNKFDQSWEYILKYEYTYNNDSKILTEDLYNWDNTENDWIVSSRNIYTYESGRLITMENVDYEWDESNKSEFSYDQYGNTSTLISYKKDVMNDQWIRSEKFVISYNPDYGIENIIIPGYYADEEIVINNMPVKSDFFEWNPQINDWELLAEGNFYYSEQFIASVSNINYEVFNVFPNPVINSINIVVPDNTNNVSFKLFDIHGKELISKKLSVENSISLESIPAGVYIYRIDSGSTHETGKIIKK